MRAQQPPRAARTSRVQVAGPLTLATLLDGRDLEDLEAPFRYWAGDSAERPSGAVSEVRARIRDWMSEDDRLRARVESLPRKQREVLDALLAAPRHELTLAELTAVKELGYLARFDLEAALSQLSDQAFVTETATGALAVPMDLAEAVARVRRGAERGVFDVFTLRGHLDRAYGEGSEKAVAPAHLRRMFKMYAAEPAAVARIERLPEGLRGLVGKVVLEFGGLLPRQLFERMESELPHWNGRRWRKILEESLVGTVERLDLTPYGIQHSDETLAVFNEVTLAWFRRVAVPSDPDKPHDEASLGVDLVANISRFQAYIIDHSVRFTVKGEIFKTTEKRILQDLIPNPGRELERADVLQFIFRFAHSRGMLESTGERTFALTSIGRDFEAQDLDAKLAALLDYVLDEPEDGSWIFHQSRMRRIFLRLVKRVEPGVWYDLMYLPFLARNAYLAQLDELGIAERIAALPPSAASPQEDLQKLTWSLSGWVKRRLYLLGLVDLGYDGQGRPVAMRLTRIGARLLGLVDPNPAQPVFGNLIVTADFEVVLFPTGDDAELIHDLDRFCDREKDGAVRHFRISDRSVHRGLVEGVGLARMGELLERNARTPVPRNVLHSIRDWAHQAGLLYIDEELRVTAPLTDSLSRFARDPGVRPYVRKTLDERSLQLRPGTSSARYRSLFRDLHYLIEPA
ncbi:MAG: helicase-associated domain-containing protein [Planctomycetota bacterium]